jgi:heat shock protein HtpX
VQLKSANQATAPMYTINPFRQKGKAAANLTSTHPPIQERVRILRAMAGASFADYDKAYKGVRSSRGGVIKGAAGITESVALRAPSKETKTGEELPQKVERARETSDMMWRLNDYKTLDCPCGTRLRISPKFKGVNVKCPHCGRILPV